MSSRDRLKAAIHRLRRWGRALFSVMNSRKRKMGRVHKEFEETLLRFCGALYIAPRLDSPPSEIIANGTFGLVDTGVMRLIVTCWHVWDFYEEEKLSRPGTVMGLVLGTGFRTYAVTPTLIDADRDMDLAVFRWDGPDPDEKAFFPVRRFPIPKVEAGAVIVFQGFPGVGRETTPTRGRFGAFFFGGIVTAVNERKILVAAEPGRSLHSVETRRPLEPFEIKGVSGSPAYTFRDGWKLAGFVCEGATTDGSIYLTHAAFINPDGTLDRSQLHRA